MTDMTVFEQITKFLEQFQLIIYPLLISGFAVGYKVYKGIKDKHSELVQADKKKIETQNREKFNEWEHNASLEVIVRIKHLCNLYKDRSGADRVSYVQLENGTLAISRLCNMFISCLAEDSRFGNLPKDIRKLQRISYSHLSEWIEAMRTVDTSNRILALRKDSEILGSINAIYTKPIGSQISIIVNDYNSVFVGCCLFEYANDNYNSIDIASESILLNDFRVAVETTLYNYFVLREKKKEELDILPPDNKEVSR